MKSRTNMNSIYRQGSGDSSYSQRSSDLSLNEEREHFRRDTERQALLQLEKGRAKPVAFSVKTNVAFDGTLDDDSPVHGYAISFNMGDYLHVMERYGILFIVQNVVVLIGSGYWLTRNFEFLRILIIE